MESEHLEQSKSVHDTYPIEQDAQNVIIDSLDMSYNREEIDQNDDDNDLSKELFAIESEHPEQSKSVHDTYPIEQDAQNMIIDSLDMSYNREEIDQNDDDNDLSKECAVMIKRVYYVKGINHNLFSIGQFCDADLKVDFRKSTCFIRDLKRNDLLIDETPEILIEFLKLVQRGLQAQVRVVRTDKGMKFLNQTLHAYFAAEGIHHQTSVARTPKQNGVVERQNRTLVEAARTMLSAAKVPLFFWAEAIATACFTQNRYLVIPRHEKTPYHIINDWKPSVKFFHIFGSLCYIVRDGENIDKMKEKGDACIFMGYSTQSRAYRVFNKRTRVIMESIHVNFDKSPQMASDHVVSKSSTVSTADAPNQRQQHTTPLNTHTTRAPTCQVLTHAPTVASTENMNQAEMVEEYAQVETDEFINIFCTSVQDRGETSSRHVDLSNMHTFYQHHPSEHRWTKDHPLEQVIGNPSQSVRTRRQLESDGEMCMFSHTMIHIKPKNIKEAMADFAWIESMQEELHQLDRLEVWELVDRPLCKNIINMKWLWKNKCDEENIVIRKKSHLVAKGYAQKEGLISKNHSHPLVGWKLKKSAGTEEEQAKNFQWGLRRSTLNHLMCMSYTDVAQVANAARNYEILHERDDDDTERPDKRQKSGNQHQPTSQQSSHRSHADGTEEEQARTFSGVFAGRRVVICISRPLSRVVTGTTRGVTQTPPRACVVTPIATKHLDADLSGTPIDQTKYRKKPTEKHLTAVKRIFRYVKDTIHMGIWYPKDTGFELNAFSNSDHAGCLDSRKSTSGGIQFLGGDKLVSWSSKKQDCTSMSSAEAENVSLSACGTQVLWKRTQLTDYGFHFDKIPMYCNSKAAIAISCNPVQHLRTKHIDVRYHLIKEKVEKGIVELFFVGTEYQLADLFTKALSKERFKYLVR
nr:integrase, catalytic region, zinc finger, CCHC-type, peptidase aspartic, catalytic [Tanacetum cinerariifolium]